MTTLQNLLLDVIGGDLYVKLETTPQASKWHAEGNVLNHTLLVMEQVDNHDFDTNADYQLMMACAILHDLGKIDETRIREDGGITSASHEVHAAKYLHRLEDKFREFFPYADLNEVCTICEQHMRAHLYLDKKMSRPGKRKAFEEHPLFKEILMFAGFDEKGRIPGVA